MYINYGAEPKLDELVKEGDKGENPSKLSAKAEEQKRKLPVGLIIVFAIVIPMLFLLVYEPGRFRVWVDGLSMAWLKVPTSAVVSLAESVHRGLGLPAYKEGESAFLAEAKSSPDVFEHNEPVLDNQDQGADASSSDGEASDAGNADDGGAVHVEKPYTVLAVGDSLILEGFGPVLEDELSEYSEVDIVRKGKYSTGLSRPDYFDWNDYIVELVEKYSPDVVIVMFGANDGQNFTVNGKPVTFDTEAWRTEYTARADHFMNILDSYGIVTFWVGNPIASSDYYTHKMEVINGCVEGAAVDHVNVHYISTWETLKDSNGNYNDYLPDANGTMKLARASDGIHCTEFGGGLLVIRVFEVMEQYVEF